MTTLESYEGIMDGTRHVTPDEILDAVCAALNEACLEEYDSTWNDDVTRRFARAAIDAQGSVGVSQSIKIEALRSAAAIQGCVTAMDLAGKPPFRDVAVGDVAAATIGLAEYFAAWLEE